MPTTHEAAARAKKAVLLVDAIDSLNQRPQVSAADVAAAVRDQDASWWCALASLAGVAAPSVATRAAVLAVLDQRARRSA